MTQEAIVTRRLPDGMAEVVVTRGTACGSNCGNCESCIFQSELKTPANNLIDAQPGQRVIIQSKSSKIFGAALLVYILPIVMILLGYFIAYSAGASEANTIGSKCQSSDIAHVVVDLKSEIEKIREQIQNIE